MECEHEAAAWLPPSPREHTHRGVDLAVLVGHAVTVVKVGEWLGGPPGLQVAGHPDRGPHLGAVQGVSGPAVQLGAPPLRLCVTTEGQHGREALRILISAGSLTLVRMRFNL